MKIAHFTELFPKLSETFILHQVTGLLDASHDVRLFADQAADEPKRHAEVDEYDLDARTTYANPPKTYPAAVSQTVETMVDEPRVSKEVLASLRRGTSGGRRIANLRVATATDMSGFDIFHAHFGDVGKSWDFLKTNDRFPTDTRFVVSFYGIDASKVIADDPNAYDRLFEIADVVTVLSEDMRSALTEVGCPRKKTVIQPLQINESRFEFRPRQKDPNEPFEIATVARFDEQKGLRYAVDAIAELVDDYEIRYSIAGDGPLFDEIERRIHDHGIGDSVELLGWLDADEVTKLMANAHLFLLPSVTAPDGAKEGTPTVLLEAQAVGLPVVSTYHAGIPEIVGDEESGLLVPEKDVDALVAALERLLGNSDRWAEMGEEGRRRIVDNHSIPAVVEGLKSIYGVV